jgi:uncharacterized protein
MHVIAKGRLFALAALSFCTLAPAGAFAQSPLACGVAPQSVCEDAELAALENERAALIAQLTSGDSKNAALASEQTWIDGLSACGEDSACYRTAYLNHNETLRQAAGALPAAPSEDATAEAPADAPTVEEATQAQDEVQAERLRAPREEGRQVYVDSGAPGWGFYTAIGVTLLLAWLLMRAHARHRREG